MIPAVSHSAKLYGVKIDNRIMRQLIDVDGASNSNCRRCDGSAGRQKKKERKATIRIGISVTG